jgi:YD repeat-containing protein
MNLKLVYDSRYVWQPVYVPSGGAPAARWTTTQGTWGAPGHIQALGWRIVGGADNVSADNYSPSAVITCAGSGSAQVWLGRYRWTDANGGMHFFLISGTPHCVNGGAAIDAYATDGSGFHLYAFAHNNQIIKIYARDGNLVYSDPLPTLNPPNYSESSCTYTVDDENGNFQTWTNQANCPIWGGPAPQSGGIYYAGAPSSTTDTLGRQPITVAQVQSVTFANSNSQNGATSTAFQLAVIGTLITGFGSGDCGIILGNVCTYPGQTVQSVTLADGSKYTFTYDCSSSSYNTGSPLICNSPGGSGVPVYGLMTTMTLPSGGTVNFTYSNFSDSFPYTGTFYANNTNRWLTGVSYGGGQWTYTPATGCGTNCQTVTVARPSGDHAVYTFDTSSGTAALNTSIQYFNGAASGNPSLTIQNVFESYPVNECFSWVSSGTSGSYQTLTTACKGFSHLKSSNISVPSPAGTLVSQTSYLYDVLQDNSGNTVTSGKLLSKSESAFGVSAPGSLVRKTVNAYLDDANPSYRTPGTITGSYPATNGSLPIASAVSIMDRVVDMQIQDGSGNIKAETKTSYDSTTLASVTGIQNHDDTNFGTGFTTRGSPTVVQKLVNGAFGTVATATYDTTGQVTQAQDANGNLTTISYADNFYNDSSPAANPPSSFTPLKLTNAYPTTFTQPIIGAFKLGYYYGSGKTAFSIDQNGADTYSHFLDPLDRPTHTFQPLTNGNRGWSLTTYTTGGTQVDAFSAINDTTPSTSCVSCQHTRQTTDSFARPIQGAVVNDPEGATYTSTTYDSSGRTHTVSNPYRTTSDPTYGLTTSSFDSLGRSTLVTEADNSTVKRYYGADVSGAGGASGQLCAPATYGYGYPALQIDEAGKKKQTWADALRNTIEVDEPDSTGALSLATCYTHDTLGNLTRVDQKGGSTDPAQWRTRTFVYDELSRLKSATEPESGTTTYSYDLNGTCSPKRVLPPTKPDRPQ